MLNPERAKRFPSLFSRITGISRTAFEQLMAKLEEAYPEYEQRRLEREGRKRAIGAGGEFKLSLEEQVFMTLFFLRHYPT